MLQMLKNEELSNNLIKLSDELDKFPLREDQDVRFLFGGDWNLIFDKSLDALLGKPTLKKNAIVKLKSLLGRFGHLENPRSCNSGFSDFR